MRNNINKKSAENEREFMKIYSPGSDQDHERSQLEDKSRF